MLDSSSSPPKADESEKTMDTEKQAAGAMNDKDTESFINEHGANGAHLLDAHLVHGKDLHTSSDGKTILIPQPSDDSNDPLNWSQRKKNIMLTVLSISAAMPDVASSMGIIALLPQAM